MDLVHAYAVALGGSFLSILALGAVVRSLWRQALTEQQAHLATLVGQCIERLEDKNAEVSQVWSELQIVREEIKIVRAEKEWLERMNDRGDALLATALEELQARRRPR